LLDVAFCIEAKRFVMPRLVLLHLTDNHALAMDRVLAGGALKKHVHPLLCDKPPALIPAS
jgi:hypothetical protein